MKRLILTTLLAFAFGIGLVLLTAAPSMAVHKGSGDLTCGACHTMHSSQGGTSGLSMGNEAGGSFVLLRTSVTDRSQLHNFCLQCHSMEGAQKDVQNNGPVGAGLPGTTPPKVHANDTGTNVWNGADFTTIGGGGFFLGSYIPGTYTPPTGDDAVANDALGRQHSIGRTNVAPPGNSINGTGTSVGVPIAALSCTSCHDPHGTNITTNSINKYRNLKAGPAMAANTGVQNVWTDMSLFGDLATSYVGGVTGTLGVGTDNSNGTAPNAGSINNIWPVWRTAGLQNSYLTAAPATLTLGGVNLTEQDNTRHVGFSAFCAQCHGAWHEGTYPLGGTAAGVAGNRFTGGLDWKRHPVNNRLVQTGASELSGAGVSIVAFGHYSNKGDTSQAPYTATDATKLPAAQGTAVAVRYYADDDQDKVFCLSCHFSHGSIYNDILRWNYTQIPPTAGAQTGNPIASNVGCQQCHNR